MDRNLALSNRSTILSMVATREGGVDRNGSGGLLAILRAAVATREGGVDRNL